MNHCFDGFRMKEDPYHPQNSGRQTAAVSPYLSCDDEGAREWMGKLQEAISAEANKKLASEARYYKN